MNVKEIVQKYLKENGFDGLYNPGECGCKADDLAPCDCLNINDCEPGYLGPPDGDYDWTIVPRGNEKWMR